MSDIETLREAAEMLLHESEQDDGACDERFIMRVVGILCRREIERMEAEAGEGDRWTKAQVDARDKVIADNAWNAALQAGIDYIKEIVGDVATEKLNAFEIYAALNSLRKGPSHD